MGHQHDTEPTQVVPRDGRYEGGNSDLFVELRLDASGFKAVSADLYRTHPGGRDYVASTRSAPGSTFAADGDPVAAFWQDSLGATTLGTIRVEPSGQADHVLVTFTLEQRLNGLPPRTDLVVVAARAGDELRRLGVELETEEGIALPGAVEFDGQELTFRECLGRAGFAVHNAGLATPVPAPLNGKWELSNAFTVLQDLMHASAQASLTAPSWELHLLMLGTSSMEGLLGVMFDSGDVLPRQGAAVFATEIRNRVGAADADRKTIQTTVHELGHALNLAHRFERVVGRADSTSFMNYDWRFLGGNQREEYWRRFSFTFDADELEFLHHAPRSALVPGGADFHTVNYWADGGGGYSPYSPEVPLPGWRLSLAGPPAGPMGSTVFSFGQPVFLEVALTNQTGSPVNVPAEVLDPKAGFLELLVQRRGGTAARGLVDAVPFVPIMQRCFDLDPRIADVVGHGESLRNNVNLTFGSSGFAFAEPGEYDVTPLLALPTRDGRELVVRGEALRIRVAHPHDMGQEQDATVLFRSDVGAWFALGGSDCLAEAGQALQEVKERRMKEISPDDPVAAAITRTAALDAMRPSTRFEGGEFTQAEGDPATAADLLNSLDAASLRAFDRQTAARTEALAEKLTEQTR